VRKPLAISTVQGGAVQLWLASLVAVAQAAGPWLSCCCVPARLATALASTPSDCTHCRPAAPTTAGCCRPQAEPLGHPGPQPAPERCPFSGQVVDAVPPATAERTDRPLNVPASFLAALPAPSCVPAPALAAPAGGVTDLPFLTAEAKLYAHHVLRC
jgi:hypothetical protein